jgi:crotonobetainyl-CoA:carnitine CoA-transferase CaiB-like acyl-CoA transferase
MSEVLKGIKVVDVSQVAAVPICARNLADFGADVLHVENPKTGDSWRAQQAGHGGNAGVPSEINYTFEAYNRNKRSVAIDLSTEEGQKVLYRLAEKADVFTTNLRLWERERYRCGYDVIRRVNPKIIYGSLTAFGKKGPENNHPAYDHTSYWSRSGLAYMLSTATGVPPTFRAAFGDNVTGMILAYGIMLALFHRERTGEGQEVDVSLLHSGYYQMTFDVSGALATHKDFAEWKLGPMGLDEEKTKQLQKLIDDATAAQQKVADFYRQNAPGALALGYETKDGRIITLGVAHADRIWPQFARAIDRPDLAEDPRFTTIEARRAHKQEVLDLLTQTFKQRTYEEWRQRLNFMPTTSISNLLDAISDPQARANDMFVTYPHPTYGKIEVIANPVTLRKTPATYRLPAPEVGQHTEEALLEAGFTWDDIGALKEKGAI